VSLRCSVASFLLGSAGLRCGRSGHNLQLPLSTPTSNFGLTSFLGVVSWNSFVKISQSLIAVNVARRFGCFTGFTAGRSDAPRCRRHFLQPTYLLISLLLLDLSVDVPFTCPNSCRFYSTWEMQLNRTGY
jgi:hypothetical protein